jgi:hypothetical protein
VESNSTVDEHSNKSMREPAAISVPAMANIIRKRQRLLDAVIGVLLDHPAAVAMRQETTAIPPSGDTLNPAIRGHLKSGHFLSYPMTALLLGVEQSRLCRLGGDRSSPKALNPRGFGTESPFVSFGAWGATNHAG